jgi:hypothetical protein
MIRRNTQITHIAQNETHHAQIKHSTQNYTKKEYTADSEYTANTINKKLSILCHTQIIR